MRLRLTPDNIECKSSLTFLKEFQRCRKEIEEGGEIRELERKLGRKVGRGEGGGKGAGRNDERAFALFKTCHTNN